MAPLVMSFAQIIAFILANAAGVAAIASFDLNTVPGYAGLNGCGQQALNNVLNPLYDYVPECQANDPSPEYASCMCGAGFSRVSLSVSTFTDVCEVATPYAAPSVLLNFCSVNAGLLAPATATTSTPQGFPTTSPGSTSTIVSMTSTTTGSAYTSPAQTGSSTSITTPSSLSKGDIAGIVVGSVVGLVIVAIILYCCRDKLNNACGSSSRSHGGDRNIKRWSQGVTNSASAR